MRPVSFLSVILSLVIALPAAPVWAAGGASAVEAKEREALELRVELNRLGSDPFERESILRRIAEGCSGSEGAEAAYWSLTDLYLDAFPEPREKEARGALELLLKRYPESRWRLQAKCRLLALCDPKEARAGQLRKELLADPELPAVLKGALR